MPIDIRQISGNRVEAADRRETPKLATIPRQAGLSCYARRTAPTSVPPPEASTNAQARLALMQAQANRLADNAALFQALGGGWWHRPAEPTKTGGERAYGFEQVSGS